MYHDTKISLELEYVFLNTLTLLHPPDKRDTVFQVQRLHKLLEKFTKKFEKTLLDHCTGFSDSPTLCRGCWVIKI